MKAAWFLTVVLSAAAASPAAAQAPAGQAPRDRPAAGAANPQFSAADLVSLPTIRRGLREAGDQKAIHPALAKLGQPAAPFVPPSMPVFRTQVVAYRPTTFEESLQAAVAESRQPTRPGFLVGAPGMAGGAPVLVGVSFDPAIVVRWIQKKVRARAVANAKREVAEELDAFLKAKAASATRQVVK